MIDPIRSSKTGARELAADPGQASPASSSPGSTLLPDPAAPRLDDAEAGAQMELLVLLSARDDRESARTTRERSDAALRRAEDAQLDALEERTTAAFTAGMFGGAATAASGGLQIAGAATDHRAWEGGGRLAEGGGKMGSAFFERESSDASTEATHQEQMAGRSRRALDDARDAAKNARELADHALTFYKEYVAAKNEALRAALFRA
jgi:hypothetical protein